MSGEVVAHRTGGHSHVGLGLPDGMAPYMDSLMVSSRRASKVEACVQAISKDCGRLKTTAHKKLRRLGSSLIGG
jgi:hypothetical protein